MEIDKLSWNLRDIFKNEEELEEAIKRLKKLFEKVEETKGKLAESSDQIYKCYKNLEEGLALHEKVYAYAMFKYHQNLGDQKAVKLFKRIESITTELSKIESFVSPEVSKIPTDILEKYLNEDRMKPYEKIIKDIIKEKNHILSKDVEEVLSSYSEVFSVSDNAYDVFTNSEFYYNDVKDENGNVLKMSEALYGKYMSMKDRTLRKNAYTEICSIYKKYINTLSELYLSRVKYSTITAKLRGYKSSLDSATNKDDSNMKVYNTLVDSVNKNMNLVYEHLKLKKQMLNLDKIHLYDIYYNPLQENDENLEYEDAKKLVIKALEIMGKDYVEKVKYGFDHNWLDVYEKENKMTGGYNMGVYGVHPFILLNYMNTMRDASTIAHEFGHAMHSYYANSNQNYLNSNYTIMVAEVASTVNEILFANYLINNEKDNDKKKILINEQLDLIRSTLIVQTQFSEFEKIVHEKIENGEALNSEELSDIYQKLLEKYYGDEVIIDENSKYTWSRIPHFYRCFYVYKYATGITSAIVIANKILSGEKGYVEKYLNMLSLGGSKDSLTLLKMVGVDLEKEETYEQAFKYFEKNLKQLKNLI